MARRSYDQACPVAHTLDLVGERWTLLIVRDLILGPARFTDLRDRLEGIAPNLLSERLRFLVDAGLIERRDRPGTTSRPLYQLTPRGRELSYVVQEIARFGLEEWSDPDLHPPYLTRGAVLALMMPERLGPEGWSARLVLEAETVDLVVTPHGTTGLAGSERPLGRVRLRLVRPSSDDDDPIAPPTPTADVTVVADIETLVALRRGELSRTEARKRRLFSITGDRAAAEQLGLLLGWQQAKAVAVS